MEKQIIQITAGQGPAECQWVVAKTLKIFIKEAEQRGIGHEIIHREEGTENRTIQSVLLAIQGKALHEFLSLWLGTIQWVGRSTFRKFHKRKNWFIGISLIEGGETVNSLSENEITYQFIRSGGPGGQHVNKVSTAVRAIHRPTGHMVLAANGRSQLQNKHEAIRKLKMLIEMSNQNLIREKAKACWTNHQGLDRGNPVRVFEGTDFKVKKQVKKYRSGRSKEKQNALRFMDT